MQWVKVANEISKDFRKKIIDMSLNKINEMQDIYDEVFQYVIDANNYRCKIQDLENIDDELMNEINLFKDENLEKIQNTLSKRESVVEDYWHKASEIFDQGADSIMLNCLKLLRSRRELNIVKTRVRTYIVMCNHLGNEFIRYMKDLMYVDLEDRMKASGLDLSYVTVQYEEEDEIEVVEEKKENTIEIKNIYSWEDMEELVIEKGYVYKRAKGSHRIYENPKTNKIIVIPAHTLGKGLSVKIQKQIVANY